MKGGAKYLVERVDEVVKVIKQTTTPILRKQAIDQNTWLSEEDIDYAIEAICDQYLDPNKVAEWLADYPSLPTTEPKVVGVVAAGNIPLAAFFDIFCVVAAGHRCRLKFSSKDSVLLPAICQALAQQLGWPIEIMALGDKVDALIASGSDTAMNSISQLYGNIPTLLRGHRSSVALLDGSEEDEDIALLTNDIFRYNSMGCRNVTLIFAPHSLPTERIVRALATGRQMVAQGYLNNYRQAVATAMLTGREIINGGHFVVQECQEFPTMLAQLNIVHYNTLAEVQEWIAAHDNHIQCIVTRSFTHPRKAPLGQAQRPTLVDWPDGVDVMHFLAQLK